MVALPRRVVQPESGSSFASIKTWLRDRYGLWPLLEMRNRLAHGVPVVWWRLFEEREVARLRRELGQLPPALVTTVVPTFRRPEMLASAVASALRQSVHDQLVVVVDDGGGLGGDLPVDDRLVVVSLSRNSKRLGLVRNVGIRLTASPYIAFLDDDNEWRSDHLEVALEALKDCDLVYTALERVRADGSRLDILSRPFNRRRLLNQSAFVDANAIVVRRQKSVRFSIIRRTKSMLPKEDLEFVMRLSGRMRVRHVPLPTVRYLLHEASYFTTWGGGTLDSDAAASNPQGYDEADNSRRTAGTGQRD